MIVECPSCNTTFPVDPNKVPLGGVHARCSVCSEVFFVDVPEGRRAPAEDLPAEALSPPGEEWGAPEEDLPGAEGVVATEVEAEPSIEPERPVEAVPAWEPPAEPEFEPEPTAEPVPEWVSEAEPTVDAEPAWEAEAEVEVEAEPVVEAEPAWEPEAEPEVVAEPAWEPPAEPEFEPEPTAEPVPEWVSEAAPEELISEEPEPVIEAGLPVGLSPELEAEEILDTEVAAETMEDVTVVEEAAAEEPFEIEPFYPPGVSDEVPEELGAVADWPAPAEPETTEDWSADEEETFVVGESPFLSEPALDSEPAPDVSFEPETFVEGEAPSMVEDVPVEDWLAEAPSMPDEVEVLGEPEVEVEPDVPAEAGWEAPADALAEAEALVEEAEEEVFGAVEATVAEVDDALSMADQVVAESEETVAGVAETVEVPEPELPTPSFGRRDPHEKAQRLARVLVSDIILYNPDRHQQATESGRLKEEFEEEIHKSWTEYVEQVGEEVANGTPYFNEALNEILARGESVF